MESNVPPWHTWAKILACRRPDAILYGRENCGNGRCINPWHITHETRERNQKRIECHKYLNAGLEIPEEAACNCHPPCFASNKFSERASLKELQAIFAMRVSTADTVVVCGRDGCREKFRRMEIPTPTQHRGTRPGGPGRHRNRLRKERMSH